MVSKIQYRYLKMKFNKFTGTVTNFEHCVADHNLYYYDTVLLVCRFSSEIEIVPFNSLTGTMRLA